MLQRSAAIGLGMVLASFAMAGVVVAVAGVGPVVLRYGLPFLLFAVGVPAAFVLVAIRLGPWLKANEGTAKLERIRTIFMNPWVRVGLALLVLPLSMVMMLSLVPTSGSWLVVFITSAWQPVMWTGFAFCMLSVVRRGSGACCAKCDYDLTGAPEGGYDVCPECGADLRTPLAMPRGSKRIIKPMVAVGVLLIIASFASALRVRHGSPALIGVLPTGSLIKEVTAAPRGFTMDEWAELGTRTLSPAQTERLFEGLLALRDSRGYLAREAEGWLDRTAMAHAVPAGLIERYYAGMLELWIAAPERASRGEPHAFRVGFGGDHRGNLSVPANAVLVVWFVPEALTVGGAPAAMEHDPRGPIAGLSMNTTNQSVRGVHRDGVTASTNGPMARVDASAIEGGSVEVRGTGTIYVTPHGAPVTSAVWQARVDVRKTVAITD